jgi:hypothetical protein
VTVVAFDQDVQSYFAGSAQDFGEAEMAQLRARGAMGASNLNYALQRLAARGMSAPRVLLMGDGVATAGDTDPAALTASLAGRRRPAA